MAARGGVDFVAPIGALLWGRGAGVLAARLPVRTRAPIPKHLVLELCRALHAVVVTAPVRMGDVILANALGTGTDVIASRDLPAS